MKIKRSYIGLIICLVFFGGYYLLNRERVVVSDVKWACKRSACMAEFSIENKTSEKLSHVLVVRAFRNRSIGKGAIVSDIVGEVKTPFSLLAGETRAFSEDIPLVASSRVDLVSVTHYKARQ